MSEIKDAIEWFKTRRHATAMTGAIKMFDTAISALEKQEPKMVVRQPDSDAPNMLYLRCPSCNALFGRDNARTKVMTKYIEGMQYCLYCGQAIKWDREEHKMVKADLDKRICDVEPYAENTQTYREFLTESAEHFGVYLPDLDTMSDGELTATLKMYDDFWAK